MSIECILVDGMCGKKILDKQIKKKVNYLLFSTHTVAFTNGGNLVNNLNKLNSFQVHIVQVLNSGCKKCKINKFFLTNQAKSPLKIYKLAD